MSPEEYCRAKAAAPGSSFYYASLFQKQESKGLIFPLFAFANEISEKILTQNDPGIAALNLQWWREEVARIKSGNSRHPVGIRLQLLQDRLDCSSLCDFIDNLESQYNGVQPQDYGSWLAAQAHGLGQIWRLSAELLECENEQEIAAVASLGCLLAVLNTLQNLNYHVTRGTCPLPVSEMQSCMVTFDMFLALEQDMATRRLYELLVERLHEDFNHVHENFLAADRKKLGYCLIMAKLSAILCDEIKRDGYRLLENRLALTPVRKLWIAWRTHHRF